MQDFARIVVIVPAQLGDVLLCTPAIHAARRRWPQARLDVIGYAGTLGMLAGNPDVNELIELLPSAGPGLRARLKEAWRLWRRYDLALVARSSNRAHVTGWLAARQRSVLLPALARGRWWKRLLAQHSFEVEGSPAVLSNLALLTPWVPAPAALSLQAPPPLPLPPWLQAQLRRPCVVVHAPSMWRFKQWPLAHFEHVVRALLAGGVQVLLSGSATPNDQAIVAQLRHAGAAPDLIDVSGRLDLRQLRAVLDRADAYLGPDTSVTHLAAAVGVPIVTVFGPSWPDYFGPWPREHPPSQPWQRRAQRQQVRGVVLLQGPDRPDRPHCVPCNLMGCERRPDSASHCLEHLAPERVLGELWRLLPGRVLAH